MHIHIYIYIYMYKHTNTLANLRAKILDFRGFDSNIILIQRGVILMSIGDFPENLSRAMFVGMMLAGRLGVIAEERSDDRGLITEQHIKQSRMS